MRPKPNIDLGEYDIFRFRLEGAYYAGNHFLATSLSTATMTANNLYGIPFPNPVNTRWDRVAVNCTTLAASALAKLGICEDNRAFYPGALISEFGEVNLGSTGLKEITLSPILTLQKGKIYWLVLLMNGYAPTLRGYAAGTSLATFFGITSGGTPSSFDNYWKKSGMTYGSLPNPFSAGASQTATQMPIIALRKAA